MKKFYFLFTFLFLTFFSNAQFIKSLLPSPAFSDSLGKIVLDFRQNFKNIQGDMMPMESNMEVYDCKVKLPGALETFIYRPHSQRDSTPTFSALMYKGDSYQQASKIYRNTFALVKKSHIKRFDRSGSTWKGELEPDNHLSFATSTLYMITNDDDFNHIVAEIELINTYSGWEVHLNIHNKTSDEEIQPNN